MNPTGGDRDESDEKRTSGRKRPYQPSDEDNEIDAKRSSQSELEEAAESSSSRWSGNDPPEPQAGSAFQQGDETAKVSQSVCGSERKAQAPPYSLMMYGENMQDPVSSATSNGNHATNILVTDASSMVSRSALKVPLPQGLNPVGMSQGVLGLDQPWPLGLGTNPANPWGQTNFAGTTSAELMHLYQMNLMQLMNQHQAIMNPGVNPVMAQQALNTYFAANPYNRLLHQQTLSSMANDAQRLQLAGLLPGTASAASLPLGGVMGSETAPWGASRGATAPFASFQGFAPSAYRPPVKPTEGPILYMPSDENILSDQQCLLRKQIELFAADKDDISAITPGRRKEIVLGQVGIRCKYCAHIPIHHRTKGAVYYPGKLKGIYQAAQNMAVSHFCDSCENIDPFLKAELRAYQQGKAASGHGGKQYWADSAKVLGVIETEDDGLRFDPNKRGRN